MCVKDVIRDDVRTHRRTFSLLAEITQTVNSLKLIGHLSSLKLHRLTSQATVACMWGMGGGGAKVPSGSQNVL